MAMLTPKGQARYTLATGRQCIAICDVKNCGHLIAATELYTVVKWKPRTDGATFLGAIPAKVRCNACQERKYPRPKIDKVAIAKNKLTKSLRVALLKIFEKHKAGYSVDLLVSKLRRRKKFLKVKKGEVTKALKALKKDKVLIVKDKVWQRKLKKTVSV